MRRDVDVCHVFHSVAEKTAGNAQGAAARAYADGVAADIHTYIHSYAAFADADIVDIYIYRHTYIHIRHSPMRIVQLNNRTCLVCSGQIRQ